MRTAANQLAKTARSTTRVRYWQGRGSP